MTQRWISMYFQSLGVHRLDYALGGTPEEAGENFVKAHGKPKLGPTPVASAQELAETLVGSRIPMHQMFNWVITVPINELGEALIKRVNDTDTLKLIWRAEGPLVIGADVTFRSAAQIGEIKEVLGNRQPGKLEAIESIINGEKP